MITISLEYKGALLVGYYLISCAGASWGLVMVMISNNTVGYTKKATVNGLQILAYGAGNWYIFSSCDFVLKRVLTHRIGLDHKHSRPQMPQTITTVNC